MQLLLAACASPPSLERSSRSKRPPTRSTAVRPEWRRRSAVASLLKFCLPAELCGWQARWKGLLAWPSQVAASRTRPQLAASAGREEERVASGG